jgi:hypothetical protein
MRFAVITVAVAAGWAIAGCGSHERLTHGARPAQYSRSILLTRTTSDALGSARDERAFRKVWDPDAAYDAASREALASFAGRPAGWDAAASLDRAVVVSRADEAGDVGAPEIVCRYRWRTAEADWFLTGAAIMPPAKAQQETARCGWRSWSIRRQFRRHGGGSHWPASGLPRCRAPRR